MDEETTKLNRAKRKEAMATKRARNRHNEKGKTLYILIWFYQNISLNRIIHKESNIYKVTPCLTPKTKMAYI